MPIKVSCKCGQSFTAKDELKGQTLLCPKCHQPLTIGAATAPAGGGAAGGLDDLFEEVGLKEVKGPRCPSCGEGMQAGAILCVHCGYNTQTNEKLTGAEIAQAQRDGAAEFMLKRAEKQLETDKDEEKKNQSQGAPAWLLFGLLLLVVGFAVTMYVLPRDQAFRYTGLGLIALFGIVQVICGIRLLIIAFQEDTVCGLLYLFLPFYSLYYVITRWSKCGSIFMTALGAAAVQGIGLGFIAIAPMLKPKPAERSHLPGRPEIRVCIETDELSSFRVESTPS